MQKKLVANRIRTQIFNAEGKDAGHYTPNTAQLTIVKLVKSVQNYKKLNYNELITYFSVINYTETNSSHL